MSEASCLELSIIIPVLNEAGILPELFKGLAGQNRVEFEIILVDGGSADDTRLLTEGLASESPFSCRLLSSRKGRARQMNAGARAAGAETLLFLHADSRFSDPLALRHALDTLAAAGARRRDQQVAGRFALRFRREKNSPSLAYYFYECKAHLGRPEGIHGDQGFLLRRDFFESVGPFDESLHLLEDTRLAETIRRQGEWVLLPAEILTSARRLETEGLLERQMLNALIMNFAAIGWDDFFREAAGIYPRQDRARKLDLLPFLRLIRQLLRVLPLRERRRLWYRTGTYVRSNVWQLAFALDVRRNFRRGLPPGQGGEGSLEAFEKWFHLTDRPLGRFLAATLVWIWFHLVYLWRLGVDARVPSPGQSLS